MSEEVVAESSPAPELEATAAIPEPVVETPELPVEASKTFTQEELDAAIGKRLAREQRKWEREQQVRMAEVQPPVPTEIPTVDQFQSPQDYANFIRQEAQKLVQQQEAQKQWQAIESSYAEREDAAMEKYDDYSQVVRNANLPISTVMADAIRSSDIGPDVAYYLGTNPKEAARIHGLPPLLQVKEIGKIEAKLADNPPARKTTTAPEPIRPVIARSANNPAFDTTDPRSIKNMTASEWIEADRARQIKKMQAANRY